MAAHVDYVLFELSLGYAIFKVIHQADSVAVLTKDFQEALSDLSLFGKMINLVNFTAFG